MKIKKTILAAAAVLFAVLHSFGADKNVNYDMTFKTLLIKIKGDSELFQVFIKKGSETSGEFKLYDDDDEPLNIEFKYTIEESSCTVEFIENEGGAEAVHYVDFNITREDYEASGEFKQEFTCDIVEN